MKGLIKATAGANTMQARKDYAGLRIIATEAGLQSYTPSLPDSFGWKRIDAAARKSAERILAERPDLKERIAVIYPGFASLEAAA